MNRQRMMRKVVVKACYKGVNRLREVNKGVGNAIAPVVFTAARVLDDTAYCIYRKEYGPAVELAACNRTPGMKPMICSGCKVNLDEIAEESETE